MDLCDVAGCGSVVNSAPRIPTAGARCFSHWRSELVEATTGAAELVGQGYSLGDYYEVGREKVREYARAVQDFHPAHWDDAAAAKLGYTGLVAPTTFVSTPAMLCNRRLFETVIADVTGYNMYVQTDQVFEMYKPVVAGDQLHTDVEVTQVRTIAGKDLITATNHFYDQSGEVAQIMRTTVVGVSAEDGIDADVTGLAAGVVMHGVNAERNDNDREVHTMSHDYKVSDVSRTRAPQTAMKFEQLSVGDELPARTAQLTRGDLVNYAGVSGDANPIHWHDKSASLAGLPDVIAHGMLTMGLGAGFVTDWLGDPGAMLRYSVRLSNYTIVESNAASSIEFTGRIKSLDAENRTATVMIIAKSGGRKVFGLATAEVRLG
ncbi:MAG: MaoC family dehydratase N-terminal domain-containing protein [Nocardia sp.]|nr:MaoC family dehydratase N-terminal domain-containing protein [Nocardia sp.]